MAKKNKHDATENPRGVKDLEEARQWLQARGIAEIECVVPDQAGVARGKIMPVSKFIKNPTMALPVSIFYQTISGDYPSYEGLIDDVAADTDMTLVPDWSTLASIPWGAGPDRAAYPRCADARWPRCRAIAAAGAAPRARSYRKKGWEAVVAPELEFYLVEPNNRSDYPLKPPVGRSGRPETAGRAIRSRPLTSSITCSRICTPIAKSRASRSTR